MRILFTGGGSGGHFYPIIAVAEELRRLAKDKKLLEAKMYFLAEDPYNQSLLFENNIEFRRVPAGKLRRYFSLSNFFDIFKTLAGLLIGMVEVFKIFPDVVFGKGGYSSFPSLFAAWLFRIPVVIHESDSVPGKVNLWAGKFARRIGVSFPEAAKYFPKEKVAHVGNPIRQVLKTTLKTGAYEFLKLDPSLPTILVLGGSLGAEIINETIIRALPSLVEKYQIIHQTGKANIKEAEATAKVVLENSQFKDRYRPFDYLNELALRMSAGVSSLIVSRAGSTIFEIATWGIPSIIIPIRQSNGNHQVENALNYGRSGACIVIEEANLSPTIIASEIDHLMTNRARLDDMAEKARAFSHSDASTKIAEELLNIGLEHES